jgi:hypothetical protein
MNTEISEQHIVCLEIKQIHFVPLRKVLIDDDTQTRLPIQNDPAPTNFRTNLGLVGLPYPTACFQGATGTYV